MPAKTIREESCSSGRVPVASCWAARLLGLLCSVALASSGCGSDPRRIVSSVVYEPPDEHAIVVETVVDLPFDTAWSELIRRLSESPYRVATLEKASRLVVIELDRSSDLLRSANQPSGFVDCGTTVRDFESDDESERFEYAVADSSRHRESTEVEGGFRVSEVERRVALQARISLYLQPEGARRTRVTVNARYNVEFEIAGTARFVPVAPDEAVGPAEAFGPRRESVRFTTFQPGRDNRSGGLVCRATGRLEHAMIALANPAAAI